MNNNNYNHKELAQDLLELGKFYFLNEKYDEAIKVLQKAQKFNPFCADIYYHLGLVYEAKNNLHNAKVMYLKATEVDSQFTLAQEHLDKLVGK
ncbi:hypothetical protein AUJ66_00885 [Candidatus Desantisbacteria bacterium CG1_02_38_46]|uniref:Uncharacterized protein n=1 Tax=Candidatus Desantisbacteria bacterium CG1_02_38_46 TaxID=1817893 RepID=A0A1J4SGM9_9BACT|nr:MAG: hypothetical protein AUJ66_00885 [Candidatus Desantisbacteria bacterium CG1_02_38_46]